MINRKDSLKEALEEYVELVKLERYFDAHEVLEEAWHPLRKANHPLKNLVKGLINGAIAFEHIKRDRKDSKRKASTVYKSFDRHKNILQEGIEEYELLKKACELIEERKLLLREYF